MSKTRVDDPRILSAVQEAIGLRRTMIDEVNYDSEKDEYIVDYSSSLGPGDVTIAMVDRISAERVRLQLMRGGA